MNIATARRTTEIATCVATSTARPQRRAARTHAVAGFHDDGQIRTRRLQRRDDSEQHRASHSQDQTEHEGALIQLECKRDGWIGRYLNLPKERHAGVADCEPQDSSGESDLQTFRDELTDQPAASGADRQTHRHLASAGRRAARQQSRDVRACDEQHGKCQGGQHRCQPRVRRILCDSGLELGSNEQPAIPVRIRVRYARSRSVAIAVNSL
jgi:hypothetical protein